MARTEPPAVPEDADPAARPVPGDLDQARRTSMAAERTWLAWWRSALAASAGALAVGRLAPDLLHVAPWPYILLGCGYASLAIALLIVGVRRQRDLEQALQDGRHTPLPFRTVGTFTVGGRRARGHDGRARHRPDLTDAGPSHQSFRRRSWSLRHP